MSKPIGRRVFEQRQGCISVCIFHHALSGRFTVAPLKDGKFLHEDYQTVRYSKPLAMLAAVYALEFHVELERKRSLVPDVIVRHKSCAGCFVLCNI